MKESATKTARTTKRRSSGATRRRSDRATGRPGAPDDPRPKRRRGVTADQSPKRQRRTDLDAPRKPARPPTATRRPPPASRAKLKPPRETDADRQARALRLLTKLKETYPTATCALRHRNAYELLVATILSAQCTDVRVNMVTPDLFRRYPDARALADANPAELEAAIRSTGFFRNKTKSLLGMAKLVRDEFGGRIPDTMEGLLRLPGVARKTANCVLGTAFGKNEGIVVDTHVGRIAERLALAPSAKGSKDAEKIEQELMRLFPREARTWLSFALIDHGRAICTARKPKCGECPLAADCPSAFRV